MQHSDSLSYLGGWRCTSTVEELSDRHLLVSVELVASAGAVAPEQISVELDVVEAVARRPSGVTQLSGSRGRGNSILVVAHFNAIERAEARAVILRIGQLTGRLSLC
jgi:hypothetical protein